MCVSTMWYMQAATVNVWKTGRYDWWEGTINSRDKYRSARMGNGGTFVYLGSEPMMRIAARGTVELCADP